MEGRRSPRRPSTALASAALALALGCIELAPFPTGDGRRVAIIVGDGASRVRVAPLDGTTDVLGDVDPNSTVFLGTLEVPYRTLVPYEDGAPVAVDLVEPDAPGARPLPIVELLDATGRAVDALPTALVTTHLPALSDNRCAASEGCADELVTARAGPLRACLRPCAAIPPPAPPAAVTPPAAPARATSRAPSGCGVRLPVETATAGLTLERCGVPPPTTPPDCAEDERMTADGACAPLASCIDGFPSELDDRRTWFVDTEAAVPGDGTRARPARSVDLTRLPAALDAVAARGALALDRLPARALTVVGPCPRALRLSGDLTPTAALTLAGLRFDGTLLVRGAKARLARVAWAAPRGAALEALDAAELELEDVALYAATATSPDARLARFVGARVSAARVSIRSPTRGTRVVHFVGGDARLDDLTLDRVELRAERGATVTIDRARAWAADLHPLADVDDAVLNVRRAVVSGRGAPTGLFVGRAARLTLADLAARARGAVVSASASQVDVTDLAATIVPGRAGAALDVEDSALTLVRVDLLVHGLAAISGRRAVTRATDLIVQHTTAGDRGLVLTAGTSTVTRAAIFGLGRSGAALYGGRHAWSDVHVALTVTATVTPRVEPVDRQSTGLFLADDAEPLVVELRRARTEGGFFGVHAQMPKGRATLRDVDVGPSTLLRRAQEDIVEPCALRLVLVTLDAARLRARGHGEQGLLLTMTVQPPPDGGAVVIEDLGVETPMSRQPASAERCVGRGDVPAIALEVGPRQSAALSRVSIREAETLGVSVIAAIDSAVTLNDLTLDEVRCRGLQHRGQGPLRVARMSARRRAWPRSIATSDDLISVTERASLEVADVDAEVDVGGARSLVRLDELGAIALRRWRARRVTTLLIHDFFLGASDGDRFIARSLVDGVLEGAERVTSLAPLGCVDVAARPPYLRVQLPRSLPVFEDCP